MSKRIRVPIPSLQTGELELDAEAARYVARVHRLRAGDVFCAFDPEGALEAEARVLDSRPRSVRCEISDVRAARALGDLNVTLLQGLGKADRFDQVVRDATALGVVGLVGVITERVVARPADATFRRERWRAIAIQAARQCGRGDLPALAGPLALDAALAAAPAAGRRLLLDPDASSSLGQALDAWDGCEPLTLLIGPEGGLSPAEVELSGGAGFERVRFGPFVLRTETAATAVLGAAVAWARRRADAPAARAE